MKAMFRRWLGIYQLATNDDLAKVIAHQVTINSNLIESLKCLDERDKRLQGALDYLGGRVNQAIRAKRKAKK